MVHSKCHRLLTIAIAAFLIISFSCDEASGFALDLHHRSSPVVRRWAEARGHGPAGGAHWPAHGSPEYYSALSQHDRALLARRGLLSGGEDGLLAFASGNKTKRFNDLGFLYYAEVSVGTPNETFLVALDTGSDLFWVPCEDCKHCAPIPKEPGEPDLRPYNPSKSSTSKQVACDHGLCDRRSACTNGSSSCPYTVQYVSANTSSSGVLVEDIVYLTREGSGSGSGSGKAVQAPVVFGCGQTQTGLFLEGPASDGLLGLGMDKVSVPSVLAARKLIKSDSFSMCFGHDGVGRINFGDAGSRGQPETPFIPSRSHPTYNVSFTSVNVGSESTPVEFTAVMDSGTSFTYLNEPEYSALTTNFNSQVRERRTNFSASEGSVPFEYCYGLRSDQTDVLLPQVRLTTKGGALFPLLRPIIVFTAQINGRDRPVGYCLAIVRNDISINIIGQNFMTDLKVIFDRERSVLGWHKFDCYKNVRAADDRSPNNAAQTPTSLNPRDNDNEITQSTASPGIRGGLSTLLLALLLLAFL